jgi:hypothetical protein
LAPNAFEMFCPLMIGGKGCGPPAILRLSRNAADMFFKTTMEGHTQALETPKRQAQAVLANLIMRTGRVGDT